MERLVELRPMTLLHPIPFPTPERPDGEHIYQWARGKSTSQHYPATIKTYKPFRIAITKTRKPFRTH